MYIVTDIMLDNLCLPDMMIIRMEGRKEMSVNFKLLTSLELPKLLIG